MITFGYREPSMATKELIQYLFTFVIPIKVSCVRNFFFYRVQLIVEDDTGAFFFACANRSRTRAAPTPT